MTCQWTGLKRGDRCTQCGYVLKQDCPDGAYRECRTTSLRTTPLGNNKYHHACPRCGWETTTDGPEEITHDCRRPEQVSQLGDRVEAALKSVGITQERYKGWKKMFGLPATCNCESRKQWLNKVSQEYGLTDKLDQFKSLMGF